MRKHAILPPSGGKRWITCTPSARIEETFPEESSEYADEGSLAHDLAEALIKEHFKITNALHLVKALERIQYHALYKKEMFGFCYEFMMFVIEEFNKALSVDPNAQIFVEQELPLGDYIEEGFGHIDIYIVYGNTIVVIDFKYGMGVPVTAEENEQMKIYALAVHSDVSLTHDIENIKLVIYQPRIDNVSEWTVSAKDLLLWAAAVLVPAAKLAFAGEGVMVAGIHCRFCRARAVCKVNADYNLSLLKYNFMKPQFLKDHEIYDVLQKAEALKAWIGYVNKYALSRALQGHDWPGMKLIEGRSNREYIDEEKVVEAVKKQGFTEDKIYEKSIVPITRMTALLGTKNFNVLLKDLIRKPKGAPVLVPSYVSGKPWISEKQDDLSLMSMQLDFGDIAFDEDEADISDLL